jgi:hypothetical protein
VHDYLRSLETTVRHSFFMIIGYGSSRRKDQSSRLMGSISGKDQSESRKEQSSRCMTRIS